MIAKKMANSMCITLIKGESISLSIGHHMNRTGEGAIHRKGTIGKMAGGTKNEEC